MPHQFLLFLMTFTCPPNLCSVSYSFFSYSWVFEWWYFETVWVSSSTVIYLCIYLHLCVFLYSYFIKQVISFHIVSYHEPKLLLIGGWSPSGWLWVLWTCPRHCVGKTCSRLIMCSASLESAIFLKGPSSFQENDIYKARSGQKMCLYSYNVTVSKNCL